MQRNYHNEESKLTRGKQDISARFYNTLSGIATFAKRLSSTRLDSQTENGPAAFGFDSNEFV